MIRNALLALALGAAPALAEDVALVVGNESYDNGRSIRAADEIMDAAGALEAAGFRVFSGEDMAAADLRALASRFAGAADGSGRIVVALSGHFAQSGAGTWFLATDARRTDPVTAGAEGLPLAVLLDIAARAPGRAVVLLGTEDRDIALGAGLTRGIGAPQVPQGVALVRGEAEAVAAFAAGALVEPGLGLASALAQDGEVAAEGFVTDLAPLVAAGEDSPPPVAEPDADNPRGERAAWALALAEDTPAAYEEFLRLYPQSANAALARAAIGRLEAAADPAAAARQAEEALGLTRDQRRAVQRNLSLLGYDTRGIDGIFGRGTRAAIEGWQRANRVEVTGFLNREQVERIDAQAARRQAELEAEAARRQAEQDRADRAFWDETGARGDEAGLRAYLRRYPDGLYAEIAQERLQPYDEARQEQAAAADRAAWERATARDTAAAYRAYLDEQPRGAFRERAEARIEALTQEEASSEAARAEEALGLNGFTRNLVESRLDALGLRPGRVDGVFDNDTRRAIRRFQSARNLPATGYLTQPTVVRLLADAILR